MTLKLGPKDRPFLPRGVRLKEDRLRNATVLLTPEKAIMLDQIGVAILSRVTGTATFAQIIRDLAETFSAPREQVERDVQDFMVGLRARMYLGVRQ